MLQTRHMRYFVAVAEELNFHRAAERLNLSQPALWRQIRDLEIEVGASLLLREPRGISLTPAGAAFLDDCRDLLERVEGARLRARRISQGQIGVLHIGINEIAGRRRELPRILQAFRMNHPEISLQLHFLMSQMQTDALRTGELDAGFLLRHGEERADFQSIRLGTDGYVLALPKDHPLLQKPVLVLADLAGEALIMPNPRNNAVTYERLVAALARSDTVPRVAQFADNENTIMNLVDAGMGLAFLNTTVRPGEQHAVTLRPVSDLHMPVDLELVWRASNTNPALAHFTALASRLSGDEDQVASLIETGMG